MRIDKEKLVLPLIASCMLSFNSMTVMAATESVEQSNQEAPAKETAESKPDSTSDADTKSNTASEEEVKKPKGPTQAEKVELWGNKNIAIRAGNAARAIKAEKWGPAISNFRALTGLDNKNESFFIGLYYAGSKAEEWNQAYLGLEELFEIKPEYKKKFGKLFAEVMKQSGEDEEAAEMDKLATSSYKDAQKFVEDKVNAFVEKAYFEEEEYVPPKPFVAPKRDEIDEDTVHIHKSKFGLTLKNAFQRSEKIIIAEYKGFESDGSISYFAPPKAIYKRVEMLKGAKVNPTFFLRYEFHAKVNEPKPKGWKFDPSKMPKKGSKWIIYIPNAIPIDGMYESYHGSYGVQAYNEKNLDGILRIIEKHKGQTR